MDELEKEIQENARNFEKLQILSREKEQVSDMLNHKMERWVYLEELKMTIDAG